MNYDFSIGTPKHPAFSKEQNLQASTFNGKANREVLAGTDINRTKPPVSTLKNGNFKVAFLDKEGRAFGLDEKLLSTHLLVLGSIGCGKTNVFNFIIESLKARMTDDDIMIIFDTKGDFERQFFKPNCPNFVLIGNGEKYENISKSWNLFDELKDSKGKFSKRSEDTAKEIVKHFFEGKESQTQPFFSDAAADLVTKVIIHLMRKAVKNHTENQLDTPLLINFLKTATTQTYYDMVTDPDNKDFLNAKEYFDKPGERPTPQSKGVFSHINTMVNDLFIGVFAERSWAGSTSMREWVKNKGKKIVFIEYDLATGETLSPMYRVIYDLALKAALGGREHRGNTYVLIDEWKLLPDLKHIDDALNYGRSLGVKVIAGLQSINQLYDTYGEDRAKSLTSGFKNYFCFQSDDYDTRKFITERFGKTYENITFRSMTTPVTVQRDGHTVEDWDILNLKVGQAFVKLAEHPPFLFHFRNFDDPHKIL